jgi:hypothetical protein
VGAVSDSRALASAVARTGKLGAPLRVGSCGKGSGKSAAKGGGRASSGAAAAAGTRPRQSGLGAFFAAAPFGQR